MNKFHVKYRLRSGMNLSIWEMADLEYMKYTFIDENEINSESEEADSTDERQKPDLFDYIDSIGKIKFIDDEM